MRNLAIFGLALVLALATPIPTFAQGKSGGGSGFYVLAAGEIEGLQYLREEEKLARDVYLEMHRRWGTEIFANIASSEQQHMDAIKNLLDKYRLEDPAQPRVGEFTNVELQQAYDALIARGSESLMEALQAGGFIEELDIGDLEERMAASNRDDILQVYGNLMRASRNHLRAFAGQIENRGVTYDAQVLTQDEVDAIIDSPMERGGN